MIAEKERHLSRDRLHQLLIANRGMAGGEAYKTLFQHYLNAATPAPAAR